ncbi:MAG: ribose 1,5-bisphosphate isomerase [Candidatus Hydrothermarchaeales archaeon]
MVSQNVVETAEKIRNMEIRGAGKIGRSAAMAIKSCAETSKAKTVDEFLEELTEAGDLLISARPSAVSLPNAVRFISNKLNSGDISDLKSLRKTAEDAADEFVENSNKALAMIGEIGARRISDGDTILTHCNSSAAISIIKSAWEQGKDIKVFVTEARPRYQGHITVRELAEEGIPTTLIVDSAVRTFMKEIDKVIVGADSIASNGAVVNKIGTSQIALAADEARVLFLVAAETYKFHPETLVGELVEIEERSPGEVADPEEFEGVTIRNPAFDVTPPEYVDLIITEKGAIPPQAAIMIIKEEFGWAVPSI